MSVIIDVAVWKGCEAATGHELLGERIFFEREIRGLSVKISPPLEPDKLYYWSVRPTGNRQWSTYHARTLTGYDLIDSQNGDGLHFKFLTPKIYQ